MYTRQRQPFLKNLCKQKYKLPLGIPLSKGTEKHIFRYHTSDTSTNGILFGNVGRKARACVDALAPVRSRHHVRLWIQHYVAT